MGFTEDDRIRGKNRLWIAADAVIQKLHESKLTDADIAAVCTAQLEANPADPRNEIYSTVLRIVGRSHEVDSS
jgi:hypothetical protein